MTRAQEAEERFGLKREVARLKRQVSKKHGSQSDEDNKTEGENETSPTSTPIVTDKGEYNNVKNGEGDKDNEEPISPTNTNHSDEPSDVCVSYKAPLVLDIMYSSHL